MYANRCRSDDPPKINRKWQKIKAKHKAKPLRKEFLKSEIERETSKYMF